MGDQERSAKRVGRKTDRNILKVMKELKQFNFHFQYSLTEKINKSNNNIKKCFNLNIFSKNILNINYLKYFRFSASNLCYFCNKFKKEMYLCIICR